MSETLFSGDGFQFGAFELDAKTGELRKEGRLIHLRHQPFQVLCALLNRAGELVTRDEMKAALWSDDADVDVEQGLNYCIKEIRVALGDSADSPRFVQTLPRRGYRFLAEVRRVGPKRSGDSSPAIEKSAAALGPVTEAVMDEPGRAGALPRAAQVRKGRSVVVGIGLLSLLLILGMATLRSKRTFAPTTANGPIRLVVLPFVDLSAGDDGYLADGLTDELIGSLGRQTRGQIGVIARSSALAYRNRPQDPAAFARELRASHFIEGSVRRDGSRVRVTVSLARAVDGVQIWSEVFDREMVGLLLLERDVVTAIGKGVQVAVRADGSARSANNSAAYIDYLRGRYEWNKRTRESLFSSLKTFQSITEAHPDFAPAWAGVADAYSVLMDQGHLAPKDAWAQARSAAEKAVALDPGLAEAWTDLGMIRGLYEWNAAGAEEAFDRAAALNPNYATRLHWQSILQRSEGRFQEAHENLSKARELDPLSLVIRVNLAGVLLDLGRVKEASTEAESVIAQSPDWASGLLLMGDVHATSKKWDEAETFYRKALDRGAPSARVQLISLYIVTKRNDLARRMLTELEAQSRTSYVSPYLIAAAAASLDRERTFKALETAFDERSPALRSLRRDPRFEPVRNDPRFERLVRVLWPKLEKTTEPTPTPAP